MSKLRGLFGVTGDINVGKTSFALQSGYSFSEIAYFNFDGKEPDVPTGKPLSEVFGFYKEYLHILQENLELKMIEQFLDDVTMVSKQLKGVKVVIVDGEEAFRKNFYPYTLKHKNELKVNWYGRGGQFKVMEELGFAKQFESTFFSSLQQRFDQIFIINHLEGARDEDSKDDLKPLIPGKKKSAIKLPLMQRMKARFWLTNTDNHLCPSAIVVKNPGFQVERKGGGIETVTLFPPKLSPMALPNWEQKGFISLWDVINHYETNPFSKKFPKIESYEMPTQEDRELVSEELTENDKQLMEQFALIVQKENDERLGVFIGEMLKDGKNIPSAYVFAKAKAAFPEMKITKESVDVIMKEQQGE